MPWDRKRLLGYVETIQLILGVTDKAYYVANSMDQDQTAPLAVWSKFIVFASMIHVSWSAFEFMQLTYKVDDIYRSKRIYVIRVKERIKS